LIGEINHKKAIYYYFYTKGIDICMSFGERSELSRQEAGLTKVSGENADNDDELNVKQKSIKE
jgi:hypothetical protein